MEPAVSFSRKSPKDSSFMSGHCHIGPVADFDIVGIVGRFGIICGRSMQVGGFAWVRDGDINEVRLVMEVCNDVWAVISVF